LGDIFENTEAIEPSDMDPLNSALTDVATGVVGAVSVSVFKNESWGVATRAHILVHGDLCWRAEPCSGEPRFDNIESWQHKNVKIFDLIRGETELEVQSPDGVAVLKLSWKTEQNNHCISITPDKQEEAVFWEHRIRLFIDKWQDIVKNVSLTRPDSIYEVNPPGDPKATRSDRVEECFEVAKMIRVAVENCSKGVKNFGESGLNDVLKTMPFVGAAFAIIGYGIQVAGRVEKDAKDLVTVRKLTLELTRDCVENLISIENLPHRTVQDEGRHKKVLTSLDTLETVYDFLNARQRKGGRSTLLTCLFKKRGDATSMLEEALKSCSASLRDQKQHYTLLGVDLLRKDLNEARDTIDATEEITNEVLVIVRRNEAALVNGENHTSKVQTEDLLKKQVRECKLIDDFVILYDSKPFQASLGRIDLAQSGGKANAEEWAEAWARKVLVHDEKAKDLNDDRKICLALLYRMCNCWQPDDDEPEATVSRKDIVKKFRNTRVVRILTLCVIMDRAQALYVMKLAGHPVGMHWYAQKHVDESDEWKEITANYDGFPTINRRLFWLVELFDLGGTLKEWLQPTKADWLNN
jgi:hypothetical protein